MEVKIENKACAYGLPNIEIKITKSDLGALVANGQIFRDIDYWTEPNPNFKDDDGKQRQHVSIVVE